MMRVVNKRKFIRTISILMAIILGLIVFAKGSYSKGEIEYKEHYIYKGDTLWSIAKTQTESNKYFENKDIREIVSEIKKVNNLDNCNNLSEGEKIRIPEYK